MRCPGRSSHPRAASARRALAFLLLAGALACDSTAPRGPGAIEILATSTVAEPFDFFSYGISVDDGEPFSAFSGLAKTILVKGLAHGPHVVSLKNIPANCSAGAQGNTRTVSLAGDDTVGVVFTITCSRTTGDIVVTVTTTGTDPDPNGYLVLLNGLSFAFVGPNASTSLQYIGAGAYTMSLDNIASNCSNPGTKPAVVTAGQTTNVSFTVTCAPLAHLRFETSSTGPDPDADGLALTLDGEAQGHLEVGTTVVPVMSGSIAWAVGDVQPNCTLGGPASGTTDATAGDTVTIALAMTCTALPEGMDVVSIDDAVGDTLANTGGPAALDVTAVRARFAPGWLIVTLRFAAPVSSAEQNAANSLYGFLEIDADESTATGSPAASNFFGANASLGVDFAVLMAVATSSTVLLLDLDTETYGLVPIRFAGDSVTVYLPLDKLAGDDGNAAMAMTYGTADRPTDVAPNTGNFVAHAPPGTVATGGASPARTTLRPLSVDAVKSWHARAAGTWRVPR